MNALAPPAASRAHAEIAPSALKRILACPQSVFLARAMPGLPPSRHAAQGTVAHDVATNVLLGRPVEAKERIEGGHVIEIDDEMLHGVGRYYQHITKLRHSQGDVLPETYIEKLVRHDAIVGTAAGMFGHLDAAVLFPDVLHVVDFKYGRGVPVPVAENPQLLAYALGAIYTLLTPEQRDALHHVELHVVQPRVQGPSVQTEPWTLLDVEMWGRRVLAPAVARITSGEARTDPLVTGEHCRFCPVLSVCPAMRERVVAAAKTAFGHIHDNPSTAAQGLTTADLATVLNEIDIITPFFDAARAEAHRRAEKGEAVPGWKLVAKRGIRAWDATKLAALPPVVGAFGVSQEDMFAPAELLSPAQMEKLIPRTSWAALKPFWRQISSGTSLAPDADARPAVKPVLAHDVFDASPDAIDPPDPT